jgi:transcriptional regulator with PAS, ATPase and Fis domain
MQQLFSLIAKLAEDDISTILIQGESGTGKELVAKAIHAKSSRVRGNFVPVNCAAIPDDLLESELFGYTKGAFTGATNSKVGRIEYADGGTLFLDEIGDMKPALQAKLLRVLQEREFEPVGGLKATPVDVRVIAATHRELERLVTEGKFREDLYYRLSVIPVEIPPLRERLEDIPLLLNYFVKHYGANKKAALKGFDHQSLQNLCNFHWRGNVRELENLVQHMTILYGGEEVTLEMLPDKYRADSQAGLGNNTTPPEQIPEIDVSPPEQLMLFSQAYQTDEPPIPEEWPEEGLDFNSLINDFETQLIARALKMTGGNKKEAARVLNLKRTTLLEKIKKKGIQDTWKEED